MKPFPTIAIIGRPNVGKSTLFNRLIGRKQAIVSEIAGTTRDRNIQKWAITEELTVNLVDTGGLEYDKQENIEEDVQIQAKLAIEDADLIIFVIDAMEELTANDFAASDILRKTTKTSILVANKCDSAKLENQAYNFFELGFGEAVEISAIHKQGIDHLQKILLQKLKNQGWEKNQTSHEDKNLKICILGKPNAGKSSLVNALCGEDKVIVSEIAGTTRDSIDTEIQFKDHKITIIDTAGLRRPGKIEKGIEKFSSLRCFHSIERSDCVILMIDGLLGLSQQDCHIASLATTAEKGLIIAINKIDAMEKDEQQKDKLISAIKRKLAFIPWAPLVFISAKNKKNTQQLLNLALDIQEERKKRIPTAEFNVFMQKITYKHLPASASIRKPKIFYSSQVGVNPPTFAIFGKNMENLHFSYPRYLENEIRKNYGYNGTAIHLKFKNKAPHENLGN